MSKQERKLYQKNTTGYTLILLHVVLNVAYSIFSLNNMDTSLAIGVFIMITIGMLLLGFLTAVKVQNYSMIWSVAAIFIGVFQFSRIFFTTNTAENPLALVLDVLLIASAALFIAGGVVSVKNSKIRKNLVIKYNRANDYGIE